MGQSYRYVGVDFYVPDPEEALPAQRIEVRYAHIDELSRWQYGARPEVNRTAFWDAFSNEQTGQYVNSPMYEAIHDIVETVISENEKFRGRKIDQASLARLRSAVNLVEHLAGDARFRDPLKMQTRFLGGYPSMPEGRLIAAIGAIQDIISTFVDEVYISAQQASALINQVDLPQGVKLRPTLSYRPRSVDQLKDKLGRLRSVRFSDFFVIDILPHGTTETNHVLSFARAPSVFFRRVGPDICFPVQIEARSERLRTWRDRQVHVLHRHVVFAPAIFKMLGALVAASRGQLPVVIGHKDREAQRAVIDAVMDAVLAQRLVAQIPGEARTRMPTGQQFLSPLELFLCYLWPGIETAIMMRQGGSTRRHGGSEEPQDEWRTSPEAAAAHRGEVLVTERKFSFATPKGAELAYWRQNMEVLWRTIYGLPRVVRSYRPEDVAKAAERRAETMPGEKAPRWATVAAPGYSVSDAMSGGEIDAARDLLVARIISPLMDIDLREGSENRQVIRSNYQFIVDGAIERANELYAMLNEQKIVARMRTRFS